MRLHRIGRRFESGRVHHELLISALRRMDWLWSVEIARPILSGWAFSGVGLPVGSAAPVARYLVGGSGASGATNKVTGHGEGEGGSGWKESLVSLA